MGKAAADGAATTTTTTTPTAGKVFSADVVAALLMSLNATTITKPQYELMSAMDGVKTASAFQHDFRSVLAKARDLKTRIANGEEFSAVQSGKTKKKRAADAMDGPTTPPATPKKPKVAPKPKTAGKPRGKKGKEDAAAAAAAAAAATSEGSEGSKAFFDGGIGLGSGDHYDEEIKLETGWEHGAFV